MLLLGWLPLHGAIYNDYDDVVALLLKAGAKTDPGVDEIKGYAPIHIAIASEQVFLVFNFSSCRLHYFICLFSKILICFVSLCFSFFFKKRQMNLLLKL